MTARAKIKNELQSLQMSEEGEYGRGYAEALAFALDAIDAEPTPADYLPKSDVERMIKDWQSECADHPALHNQGNVLLDRLAKLPAASPTPDWRDCLTECLEYFEKYSDSDYASEIGFIPNEEMVFALRIKTALGES